MTIPYTHTQRPDTGVTNPVLGLWLFLASEVMLFGSLLSSWVLLRLGNGERWAQEGLDPGAVSGLWKTGVLVASSVTMLLAVRAARAGRSPRALLLATLLLGAGFVGAKTAEAVALIERGLVPSRGVATAMFHTLSGAHLLHVVAGLALLIWLLVGATRARPDAPGHLQRLRLTGVYWQFVDAVWLVFMPLLYVL